MSKFVSGVLGLTALVASLGAAQFAVGHDLTGSSVQIAATAQGNSVNRSNKTDRTLSASSASVSNTRTQVSALNDTSVVIRIQSESPLKNKPVTQTSSRPVACEAPASVLTDIAKQMASGRCVT